MSSRGAGRTGDAVRDGEGQVEIRPSVAAIDQATHFGSGDDTPGACRKIQHVGKNLVSLISREHSSQCSQANAARVLDRRLRRCAGMSPQLALPIWLS